MAHLAEMVKLLTTSAVSAISPRAEMAKFLAISAV